MTLENSEPDPRVQARPQLLTPQQADDIRRLHALGLFEPTHIARMVAVDLERILRSFRLTSERECATAGAGSDTAARWRT